MGYKLKYTDLLKTYKTQGYRQNHLRNYKKLFPFRFTPTLAGVVADIIGDGTLQAKTDLWRLDFTSKSKKELKRFEGEIYKLFKIKGKIRRCTSNKFGKTYNLGINNAPITRILFLSGVPSGCKVLKEFHIPKWIIQDKQSFKRFAQRLFTCEGCIMHEKNRKIPQVRMMMWKSEKYLEQCREFFYELAMGMRKYFNISSTIGDVNIYNTRKDGVRTRPIVIYILGDSVFKFAQEIGFEGEKQEKLNKLLERTKH